MPVSLTAPKPPPHTYLRPQVREIPRRLEAVTHDSFGGLAFRSTSATPATNGEGPPARRPFA
jgi:hypothetical protein